MTSLLLQILAAIAVISSTSAFTMSPNMLARSGKLVAPRATNSRLMMVSTPHGGKLINTMVTDSSKKNEIMAACDFEMELDERQLCDVELLMQGGFSPLSGFMEEADYTSVVTELKITSGEIFGLPVVYDTNDARVVVGKKVLLSYKGTPIATLDVTSRYTPNKPLEAKNCYGTTSIE
ncbi:PUA-like domain-containing protein, partial [Ochromonadaceae sp. CCMP2298]